LFALSRKEGSMIRRLGLAFVVLLTTISLALACGVERWPVKVGEDKDAGKVNLTPRPTTIVELSGIGEPSNPNIRKDTRFAPTELTTFVISTTLVLIKFEADDDDYHLVIKDNRGRTMIIESPNPECAKNSVFLNQIKAVRSALDGKFPSLGQGRIQPNIPITVVGIGFFDKKHRQEGRASNAIELHPMLSVAFHN
jgi:hypothetical protein